MFSALMYELGVIKSWTKAGNGPSFGLMHGFLSLQWPLFLSNYDNKPGLEVN